MLFFVFVVEIKRLKFTSNRTLNVWKYLHLTKNFCRQNFKNANVKTAKTILSSEI